jgi:hypothetical protein
MEHGKVKLKNSIVKLGGKKDQSMTAEWDHIYLGQ